jgi:phage recombination protein Bet
MTNGVATSGPQLPEQVTRRGISDAQWRTLSKNLFPGANPNSVLMVWDYCLARRLDPLKKPCHIVPMEVKDVASGKYEWRDVVMPGIYEYRTTAQRTGEYLGHSKPEYGEPLPCAGVTAPEWCDLTAYRWNGAAGQRVEFPVRVFFREVVATKRGGDANARWSKAPIQMLTKCAEAAALREAFPDELGGEQTAEEMDGQRAIDVVATDVSQTLPKPDKYDDWLTDLQIVANDGDFPKLEAAWAASLETHRTYLNTTDPGYWESLKARAAGRLIE